MSRGSRATQVNPEALVILFRAKLLIRYFMRMAAASRPDMPDFHREIIF
jgi:hypothetical protein